MQYSDREIKYVAVGEMGSVVEKDGANSVRGTVNFTLRPMNESDLAGPTVSVSLSIDLDPSEPVRTAEKTLLAAAHGVLNRFAHESLEKLQEIHSRTRDLRT